MQFSFRKTLIKASFDKLEENTQNLIVILSTVFCSSKEVLISKKDS